MFLFKSLYMYIRVRAYAYLRTNLINERGLYMYIRVRAYAYLRTNLILD